MSQEDVDFVRSIYAGWERGDYSSSDWAHPQIEWNFGADGPSPTGGIGIDGMAENWVGLISAWEDLHHEVDEYVDLNDGRVLVLQHLRGRGKASGLEIGQIGMQDLPGAVVLTVSGGKVTRLVGYFHRERALADLGLSE